MFKTLKRKRLLKRAAKGNWPEYVQTFLAQAAQLPDKKAPWHTLRFVVFDTETTGLDLNQDQILSIGALGVHGEEARVGDSLELVVQSEALQDPAAIAVHGITPEEAKRGIPEEEAMRHFLDYLQDGIIVAHHAAFDIGMIERAVQRQVGEGFFLPNLRLDTAHLARHLEHGRTSDEYIDHRRYSLDALCQRYDITMYDRHTAWGDTLITTKLLLKLMRLLRANNEPILGNLLR
jgi:DNA polymerase III subunit epsilon